MLLSLPLRIYLDDKLPASSRCRLARSLYGDVFCVFGRLFRIGKCFQYPLSNIFLGVWSSSKI